MHRRKALRGLHYVCYGYCDELIFCLVASELCVEETAKRPAIALKQAYCEGKSLFAVVLSLLYALELLYTFRLICKNS